MRIKVIIATLLYLFFGVNPVFAVTFDISNPQQYGDEIIIDVSLSGLTSTSCLNGYCYLQAAFTSPELTRYFGFTKNHSGQWYEYIGSPETSYILATFFAFQPIDGTWSGQISLKNNPDDPDYKGPGNYNVKAWRYSGKSSSAAGDSDNVLAVYIQGPTPSPTSSPTPIPPATSTPIPKTPTPTPKKNSTPTPTPTSISRSTPSDIPISSPKIRSVKSAVTGAAETSSLSSPSASPTPLVEVASQKQNNPFIFIGVIFIIVGVGSLGYMLFKNEAIYKHFRKRN